LIVTDEHTELDNDKEEWTGLTQREDSGIVNGELATPVGSSGDQPVSSSSDGEVTMVHQAEVIVHVSADVTPGGAASGGVRNSRRRASIDSNDRFVYIESINRYKHLAIAMF